MKFSIILFLGCLTFVMAQRPYDKIAFHSSLFDKISQSTEDFVKSALTPFKTAYEKVKDILTKSYIKMSETVQKAIGSLTTITHRIETAMEDVKKNNSNSKECVDKHEIQLNEIKDKVQNKLQLCAEDFIKQLQNQESLLRKNFNEIDKNIEEFRLAAVTCIHFNPVTTTKCIYSRISDYRQLIAKIGTNFKQTVENASTNAVKIPKELVTCNQNEVQAVVKELDDLLKNVQKCGDQA